MNYGLLKQINRPPWRILVVLLGLLIMAGLAYQLWPTGQMFTDGRHDRGSNAIWLAHGWLGGDNWFETHKKTNELHRYRQRENIRALAAKLRENGITDVFPHLCPAATDGALPEVHDGQTDSFLSEMAGIRVIPWIGGPNDSSIHAEVPAWRRRFVTSVAELLRKHPRLAGVQINVEPLPSGDTNFLTLLRDLRTCLRPGQILSLAAYPPPTRWHPFPEVHWDESYFRETCRLVDQVAVMMYDTGIRWPKSYQKLMSDWTMEVLNWAEGRAVLLGVPTYSDTGVEYHHPEAENLSNALAGIHHGLGKIKIPSHYQGLAIYCGWETSDEEWRIWRKHFRKP